MLKLPGFLQQIGAFDAKLLGYPWKHADARVDNLQKAVQAWVAEAETQNRPRHVIFARIWEMAHAAAGQPPPPLPSQLGAAIPHLSEPWYCCAEPTEQQLQSF